MVQDAVVEQDRDLAAGPRQSAGGIIGSSFTYGFFSAAVSGIGYSARWALGRTSSGLIDTLIATGTGGTTAAVALLAVSQWARGNDGFDLTTALAIVAAAGGLASLATGSDELENVAVGSLIAAVATTGLA
jgi:hypothetical protein